MMEKRIVIPSLLKNGYAILLFFLITLLPQPLVALQPEETISHTHIPANDVDTKSSDPLAGKIYITEGTFFVSDNTVISGKIISIREKPSEKKIINKKDKKAPTRAGILKPKTHNTENTPAKNISQTIAIEYPETYSISGLGTKSVFVSVTTMKLFYVIEETDNEAFLILLTLIFFAASFYRSIYITAIPAGQLFERPPPYLL